MNNIDIQNFTNLLNQARSVYDKPAADSGVVKMWWRALERFEFTDVVGAFSRHLQDTDQGQFFPKPADVIRNISGNTQTRAGQAWTKIDRAVRTVGPYQTVVFDDPLIHAVVDDMGGWVKLCDSTDADYKFKQLEFEKRYRGYCMNPPQRVPRKLIGSAEHHNAAMVGRFKHGHDQIEAPVVIGDVEKARIVYQSGTESGQRAPITAGELLEGGLMKLVRRAS